jgi:hypothetical protein
MLVLVVILKSGRSPPLSKTTAFREAAKRFLPFFCREKQTMSDTAILLQARRQTPKRGRAENRCRMQKKEPKTLRARKHLTERNKS